jgi:hydroxymethylglutaryl-CoA lyase
MIEICEVGPRDGLQNECKLISTDIKAELITRLIDAGVRNIEAVSFVNPKVVPKMADAEEVLKLLPKDKNVRYGGLVLSRSGLERALKTDINFLHVVTTTSDRFILKNAKRTVDQAVAELSKVITECAESGKGVAGVLGTAFGCPFEGEVPQTRVLSVSEKFIEAGCTEDMVNMFRGMRVETGADLNHLLETAKWMEQNMDRPLDGMLMKAGIA